MVLDPYSQADHPECKSQTNSSLCGYITGNFISIFKVLVRGNDCGELVYFSKKGSHFHDVLLVFFLSFL